MALIREVDNKWTSELAEFHVPLRKGLVIMISPNALTMASRDARRPKQELPCRLIEWKFRINDDKTASLELIVEDVSPGWFARRGAQLFSWVEGKIGMPPAMIAGLMTGLIALVLAAFVYSNQDLAWSFAGRHIRSFGGWTLFFLFIWLIPAQLGLFKGRESFGKTYIQALFSMAALLLPVLWLRMTSLPEHFGGSTQEYAAYAHALATKFSGSYWPVLLPLLPWMAAGFKIFGFESAEKTADAISHAAKTE